jgi:hypothetical protein
MPTMRVRFTRTITEQQTIEMDVEVTSPTRGFYREIQEFQRILPEDNERYWGERVPKSASIKTGDETVSPWQWQLVDPEEGN